MKNILTTMILLCFLIFSACGEDEPTFQADDCQTPGSPCSDAPVYVTYDPDVFVVDDGGHEKHYCYCPVPTE